MDWPEKSAEMTPIDNKENSSGLMTAQTETSIKDDTDSNDKRLKPMHPAQPDSLPPSTDCQVDERNSNRDNVDMVVNLADIEGPISVGDEIMCSVDQFGIKNDLNLLNEQISSVIIEDGKEIVPDGDLEKDLTGPVEENKEFKSICEIITSNSSLTSIVTPAVDVNNDEQKFAGDKSSKDEKLSIPDKIIEVENDVRTSKEESITAVSEEFKEVSTNSVDSKTECQTAQDVLQNELSERGDSDLLESTCDNKSVKSCEPLLNLSENKDDNLGDEDVKHCTISREEDIEVKVDLACFSEKSNNGTDKLSGSCELDKGDDDSNVTDSVTTTNISEQLQCFELSNYTVEKKQLDSVDSLNLEDDISVILIEKNDDSSLLCNSFAENDINSNKPSLSSLKVEEPVRDCCMDDNINICYKSESVTVKEERDLLLNKNDVTHLIEEKELNSKSISVDSAPVIKVESPDIILNSLSKELEPVIDIDKIENISTECNDSTEYNDKVSSLVNLEDINISGNDATCVNLTENQEAVVDGVKTPSEQTNKMLVLEQCLITSDICESTVAKVSVNESVSACDKGGLIENCVSIESKSKDECTEKSEVKYSSPISDCSPAKVIQTSEPVAVKKEVVQLQNVSDAVVSENKKTPATDKNSTTETSKEISEAVKFFFQQGSSHLEKFLGPSFPPVQNSPAKVSVRKVSSDSEPSINHNQTKVASTDIQQRPRSCETAETIPIAFIPESLIDSSGRKLPPLLPKIPVAFLISDVRNLTSNTITAAERKPVGLTVREAGSSTLTKVTTNVASVGVNTTFGTDGVTISQTVQQPLQPQKPILKPQKQKKCSRAKKVLQNPNMNQQLHPSLFNAFGNVTSIPPSASGFITSANLSNGPFGDIKSFEKLFVNANSGQRQQTKPKGQPRNKGVRQRAQRVSTSIDDGITIGGGSCGRRLQNVVNKLHQAIDPNAAAGMSHDSILHTLLVSKDKLPDRTGPVSTSVQCLKVVESTPSMQSNIVTTFRIPSALTIIPQTVIDSQPKTTELNIPKTTDVMKSCVEDNVVNRLKKLGTIIEVEREPHSVTPSSSNSPLPPPPPLTPIITTKSVQQIDHSNVSGNSAPDITAQCLKMLESLAQTGNLVTSVTRKKPQKKRVAVSVPNKSSELLEIAPKPDVTESEVLSQNSPKSIQSQSKSSLTESVEPVASDKTTDNKIVPSDVILEPVVGRIENESAAVVIKSPPVEPKFVFQIDRSHVLTLPGGQRMLTCDICDGVYHKTMSLKKHYLRSHINKKYLSDSDQIMCGMMQLPVDKPAPPKKITKVVIDDLSNWVNSSMPGLFRCVTCNSCFDQKDELKTHLVEHPPVSLMKVKEGALETFMCSGCSKTFARKKLFMQHRKICDQKNAAPLLNQHCLYCDKSFLSISTRNKHHFKLHHPKRKYQPCFVCKSERFRDTSTLFKHMCLQHKDKYFGCIECKVRFLTRTELVNHNKENHTPKKIDKKQKKLEETVKPIGQEESGEQKVKVNSESVNKHRCGVCDKAFSSVLNVSRHHRLAHGIHPRKKLQTAEVKKVTVNEPKDNKNTVTESVEQLVPLPPPVMDQETLFYSRIAINIRENLLHHLDGKLDSQEVLEYDLNTPTDQASKNKLMNFSASFTSSRGSAESDSSLSDNKHSSNPVSPKVPWEKFNFPKNYDGRCGLTSYIKDMSHLDISTQLTMRRNLQRLNSATEADPSPDKLADIPAGLSLIGSSCAESFGESNSNENIKEEKEAELSGEWTRPRSYVCAVCNLYTSNLWELEDHKVALHPNVWCPHHEVLSEHVSCWELVYTRATLAPSGILGPQSQTEASPTNPSNRCTKCTKQYPNLSDLHRHMLDCGGDTTWMSTMLAVSSPGGSRRNRKWRPFGSRRRRQQGRRGLKRNIPNTPAKQPGMRIRTKPGDTESIQKMIANLPPKRTRRIIGEDAEIKTRSQGTINSISMSSNIQKARAGLKFVKKQDVSKSSVKSPALFSGKAVKETKTTVEDKKDNTKPLKKPNKSVKKLLTESNNKKKQELVSENKTDYSEVAEKKIKDGNDKDKKDVPQNLNTTVYNDDEQILEVNDGIEENTKCEKMENKQIGECKEINIVVVSSKRPEEIPEVEIEKDGKCEIVQVITDKICEDENDNISEENRCKVDKNEKCIKVPTYLKEDKAMNTEICENETAEIISTMKAALTDPAPDDSQVLLKSEVLQKKIVKGKKDENEKKKKESDDSKNKICVEENLIICNGCGMQFDSGSACQRHMKKCVYWKEEKIPDKDVNATDLHTCGLCSQTFPFLMALLRHKCDSPVEDRAMPELIREEPFAEAVAPVEVTNDIPVLSPEEVRKNIINENKTESTELNKSAIEKVKIQKTVSKNTCQRRTSSIESIVNTISEVSKESYSLDHYMTGKRFIDNDKKPEDPPALMSNCNTEIKETSDDNSTKKVSKEIVIVNSTIKTIPKLVKINSSILPSNQVKEKENNDTERKKSALLQKTSRGIKRKLSALNNRNKNKTVRKNLLNRPKIKKKRSTALEILLRENRLMAESRKPVKTVEKRRSNSPIRAIVKRFGKRRKLSENLFCLKNDTESKNNEIKQQELSNSKASMNVEPDSGDDCKDVSDKNEENIESESQASSISSESNQIDKTTVTNKDLKTVKNSAEQTCEDKLTKDKNNLKNGKASVVSERTKQPLKIQNKNAVKKLNLQSDKILIVAGTRRKTNVMNRWDMYRPSCSNGKVYCEPCNKEVKEDGMAKHEQSALHIKNIDLKNDFDNLFPDAYKFIINCSHCSRNFPTPFTCYKHYLQKHEDSLPEIIEHAMAKKGDTCQSKEKITETKTEENSEENKSNDVNKVEDSNMIKVENDNLRKEFVVIQQASEAAKKEISGEKQTEDEIKLLQKQEQLEQTDDVKDNVELKNGTGSELKFTEEVCVHTHLEFPKKIVSEDDPQNLRVPLIKPESPGNKLVYCDVCNKGIKYEIMSKHSQGCVHKKNLNLKKEFDLKFPDDRKQLFPVYCEKCNWHFTSPFLCYKHYLWKHSGELTQLIEEIKSKSSEDSVDVIQNLIASGNVKEESVKSEQTDTLVRENLCDKLVEETRNATVSPSHLFCKMCCKKVKYDLINKHINTSLHKQNLESSTEDISLPTDCKWCQWIDNSPFLCFEHNDTVSETVCVGTMKKKRKKKKHFVKREAHDSDNSESNERLINFVKQGRVVKKKKKLKFKKLRDKLQNILKDNSLLKLSEKSGNSDNAIEIRTDINTKVSSERLLKRRKKRFKFRQIRNRWKVSVVDPGLASMSDSSCNDIKIEAKTDYPDTLALGAGSESIATAMPNSDLTTGISAAAATERRSSSVGGSEFYCLLCQKQFSSAVLLVRHQNSPMHKFNESQNVQPPRILKFRGSESHNLAQSKQGESSCASNSNIKGRDAVADVPGIPASQLVSHFQGSCGSETNQEWIDSSRLTGSDQRGSNVDEQLSSVPHQDWTHDWVMSGSSSGITQWDINSSSVTSQLWDNNNSLITSTGCTSSLGSILDSVNKILADDGDASILPQYSLAELQNAMGASDEEMAMLQQLGERSLQDEFMYGGSGSLCSQSEHWSVIGSVSGSAADDSTTTLMDLDNQQPTPPSVAQQQIAQQTNPLVVPTNVNSIAAGSINNAPEESTNLKTEPVDYYENIDKGSCRGLMGRPRRLLSDYESREMVCPSCCKHFLGLSALQTHLAWSQCSTHSASNNHTRSNMWLKRRALLNRSEDVDRRLVCFRCKEIFNCPSALDNHVSTYHLKKETSSQLSPNHNSDCSDGAEKLKSKMSSALGGLLDRALNNLLCSKGQGQGQSGQENGPELSSGTIQLLGKLCAVRRKTEGSGGILQGMQCRQDGKEKNYSSALATELRQIISRGKCKTENSSPCNNTVSPSTTLDHLALVLANGQEQRPYACPICDDRFLIPSTRNRHIARAHGIMKYGRKCDNKKESESVEQDNPADTSADNEYEQDWRDMSSPNYDSDVEEGTEHDAEVKPLCSDCGLSFPSIQEVVRHRKELHPSQSLKEQSDLPVSENIVDSTSGEGKRRGRRPAKSGGKQSAVGHVESTKQTARSRKRQRSTTSKKSEKTISSEESEQNSQESDKSLPEETRIKLKEEIKTQEEEEGEEEMESDKNLVKNESSSKAKQSKSTESIDDGQVSTRKRRWSHAYKRKVRLAHLAQEDVRVKAEAALRELNLPKRNKAVSTASKWGVETLKFTKQNPSEVLRSATAALARAKFASLMADSQWKIPNSSPPLGEKNSIKVETLCQSTSEPYKRSDVYEFDDEEPCSNKVMLPYGRDDKDRRQDDNEKYSFIKEGLELPLDS
ncbi:uncharacterized protein LOC142319563 isoform X2 [Lycorma delicatula]|uniref:uncharacterized protein LOC142319563 isoform X2 n=1 Tax=Lycorma delicatula TaxID=130591 RepID=UPI003F5193A1